MRIIKDFILLAMVLVLASCLPACASTDKGPKVVYRTVEEYRPLPGWATIELALPPLESTTVEGHLKREKALEAVVDQANCHRKLLEQLDKGQIKDPAVCRQH